MKSKESPNLYELLKTASGAGLPPAPETVAPRPITRLHPAPAPAESVPPPRIVVAGPAPAVEPVVPAAPPSSPGDRVLRVTMNNAVFAGLIVLALLFGAYALGIRSGKRHAAAAAEESAASAPTHASAPDMPASPGRFWAVRLCSWPAGNSQASVVAMNAAREKQAALDQQGFKGAWTSPVRRGNTTDLVLWWGRFEDRNAAEARERLATLKQLKVKRETPFAKADFEEVAAR